MLLLFISVTVCNYNWYKKIKLATWPVLTSIDLYMTSIVSVKCFHSCWVIDREWIQLIKCYISVNYLNRLNQFKVLISTTCWIFFREIYNIAHVYSPSRALMQNLKCIPHHKVAIEMPLLLMKSSLPFPLKWNRLFFEKKFLYVIWKRTPCIFVNTMVWYTKKIKFTISWDVCYIPEVYVKWLG